MAYKILNKCPVCGGKLNITKLECSKCKTVIENKFELSTRFEYLTSDQLNFVGAFLKNRGNIKDVEKELGISYPTVRAKLDEVLTALGYNVAPSTSNVDKKKVIDMLDKGEITPDEAIKMLNE
ncbi:MULTISPECIES: DUF2089 domain-containing protein [Clostridium]|uniref:DUF2089 domain-containing protein n=1 Tax=Clostridium TaxID=1485 RepID=UPI00069D078B|nr:MULTISPECIES: DUF2089 domain-containing protein [Clostridium]KOF57103.1 hypothetical protein AGR56_11220 [Clostridium sp. DMHC 10]MCD2348683.1 DUF2089 domain-containing protein [Clostridium guangxiense]